jgi:hypothetical protein
MPADYLQTFTMSYLGTAEWCDIDSDKKHTGFTMATIAAAKIDCAEFIKLVQAEFTESEATAILTRKGQDVAYTAAHDFWLTRNHHGAGFWDDERYNQFATNGGKRLTDIAHKFTGCNVFVNRGRLIIE